MLLRITWIRIRNIYVQHLISINFAFHTKVEIQKKKKFKAPFYRVV